MYNVSLFLKTTFTTFFLLKRNAITFKTYFPDIIIHNLTTIIYLAFDLPSQINACFCFVCHLLHPGQKFPVST